jgi:ferredoxin-thioredoxin reductase catalytic subunit
MSNYSNFKEKAEQEGYFVNEDKELVDFLLDNLELNNKRYGYPSCPCRLGSGDKKKDFDIICPCDYRDKDLNEYGACHCLLYVSKEVFNEGKEVKYVPDRRNDSGKMK